MAGFGGYELIVGWTGITVGLFSYGLLLSRRARVLPGKMRLAIALNPVSSAFIGGVGFLLLPHPQTERFGLSAFVVALGTFLVGSVLFFAAASKMVSEGKRTSHDK